MIDEEEIVAIGPATSVLQGKDRGICGGLTGTSLVELTVLKMNFRCAVCFSMCVAAKQCTSDKCAKTRHDPFDVFSIIIPLIEYGA